MKSLLLGALLGFLLVAAIQGTAIAFFARAKVREVTLGWTPASILVAKTDVPDGTPLRETDFKQVEIPIMFVHDGHVAASDQKLVVGAKLREPLQRGDPLVWSAFAQTETWDRANACVAAHAQAYLAVANTEPTETFDAVAAAVEATQKLSVEALPELLVDANGDSSIVVASTDLGEGETLTEQNTAVVRMPARLLTKSAVPASERQTVYGAKILTALQKNDVVRWPEVEPQDAPASFLACIRSAQLQKTGQTRQLAAELARSFAQSMEAPR